MSKIGVEKIVLGDDLDDWLTVLNEINSGGGSAIFAGESCCGVELALSNYFEKHGVFDINKYNQNSYGSWKLNISR